MIQSHLFGLSFLLFLSITEFTRSKSFTAHLDPSLSRRPRDVQNDMLTPLSLHVASKITSRFANTLVTSTLENRSLKSREAKFVVLLPETAFISNFSMVVNETHYIGKVKEKQVAETEYHNAKQEDIIAGLVSLILSASQLPIRGMDNFEIKINMAPKSRAEFYLSYQQLLVRRNGYYEQVISIRPKQIVPELKVVVDIEEPQALRYVDVMKIRQYPSDALEKGNPLATVTYTSPTLVHIEYNPSENDQKNQGLEGVDGDFIVR